jgi:NADPH:quinone reductase
MLSAKLTATAIFDGVGGALLTDIIGVIPAGATIYAYGFLDSDIPLSFHTSLLMKGITIKGFNNFKTETVQDHEQLAQALSEISKMIHMPHFRFKAGKKFSFEQVEKALSFTATKDGKAILTTGGIY